MPTYVKRDGSWKVAVNGLRTYVKRAGAWENLSSGGENVYVKLGGTWKRYTGTVIASATHYRRYQLTWPAPVAAQAATTEAVQARMDGGVLQVVAYLLPGDGSLVIDVQGTQATATAMTNAVKGALEPWATVASLGPVP